MRDSRRDLIKVFAWGRSQAPSVFFSPSLKVGRVECKMDMEKS